MGIDDKTEIGMPQEYIFRSFLYRPIVLFVIMKSSHPQATVEDQITRSYPSHLRHPTRLIHMSRTAATQSGTGIPLGLPPKRLISGKMIGKYYYYIATKYDYIPE